MIKNQIYNEELKDGKWIFYPTEETIVKLKKIFPINYNNNYINTWLTEDRCSAFSFTNDLINDREDWKKPKSLISLDLIKHYIYFAKKCNMNYIAFDHNAIFYIGHIEFILKIINFEKIVREITIGENIPMIIETKIGYFIIASSLYELDYHQFLKKIVKKEKELLFDKRFSTYSDWLIQLLIYDTEVSLEYRSKSKKIIKKHILLLSAFNELIKEKKVFTDNINSYPFGPKNNNLKYKFNDTLDSHRAVFRKRFKKSCIIPRIELNLIKINILKEMEDYEKIDN